MHPHPQPQSILEVIQEVVRDELGIDRPVDPTTSLRGELGLDSVETVVFAVELERRLAVDLRAEHLELSSVADLIGAIERLLARRPLVLEVQP